jgi:DNA-binding XRE family transcriptional regulator
VVLHASTDHISSMAKPSPTHANDPSLVALGATIRSTRTALNMSQEALALAAGLDRSYMGGIERGEHNIALINIIKIASALKLKASDLLITSSL